MKESEEHKKLKEEAIKWLHQIGCWLFSIEVADSYLGRADACGIKKNGDIYFIEAKATQKDLESKKQKYFNYKLNHHKPANFYYLILPEEGVEPNHEWNDWGIIKVIFREGAEILPKVVREAKRFEADETWKKELYETLARSACLRAFKEILFA